MAALTAKQELAVVSLSQGRSQTQTATSTGIGLRTIQRWCQQPEFQAAIRTAQKEAYDQAIAKLVVCSSGAVAVLGSIASDAANPASARVAACRAILDAAYRGYAQAELERRVAELEEQLKP